MRHVVNARCEGGGVLGSLHATASAGGPYVLFISFLLCHFSPPLSQGMSRSTPAISTAISLSNSNKATFFSTPQAGGHNAHLRTWSMSNLRMASLVCTWPRSVTKA